MTGWYDKAWPVGAHKAVKRGPANLRQELTAEVT